MWQYVWAHLVYHLVRLFPRTNRFKITLVVVMVLTVCLLVPQFWVLLEGHSIRWCSQPLFPLLITSIIFTFFLIGFVFLFLTMMPVPREVKVAFHIFGFVTFLTALIQVGYTSKAEECNSSTEALYKLSVVLTVLGMVTLVYIVVLLPFWIANHVKLNCVLNTAERKGLCYEPVRCCSCLWHI
ncbi:uncharacterized protein LOC112556577 [Pomacea canaliculata]|uniref:uncharacterized protein LOC112556577 n=1 Tax=Pomacea canaliculata TaxID=400727 RepID=UPI000D72AAB2|nr:uncharacterized protein LOC112556577 [Pomacea canaliculata]